jgi:hypothetical protein
VIWSAVFLVWDRWQTVSSEQSILSLVLLNVNVLLRYRVM